MFEKIGSYEAKTKLSEILRRVEAGEGFTITKRGKPVADVVPSRASDRLRTDAAIANILKAAKHKISSLALDDLKNAGRKDSRHQFSADAHLSQNLYP